MGKHSRTVTLVKLSCDADCGKGTKEAHLGGKTEEQAFQREADFNGYSIDQNTGKVYCPKHKDLLS